MLFLENLKKFLNNLEEMSSIESILFQLTSGIMTETSMPTEYALIPEIAAMLIRYNWHIAPSYNPGWTTFVRRINYSS
jgi:hypothetical protein